jgi:hypothetical protein
MDLQSFMEIIKPAIFSLFHNLFLIIFFIGLPAGVMMAMLQFWVFLTSMYYWMWPLQ